MVSRKRTFKDDDAVDGVNHADLVARKMAKTKALAKENAELDTVSRKSAFEDDYAVNEANHVGLAGRKLPKTKARAKGHAKLNAGAEAATAVPVTVKAQVVQETPTAPTVSASVPASASAPAPVSFSEDASEDEDEGSHQPSYSSPKNKGKGPAPRDPPDTAVDLQKKKLWRIEWEKEMVGKLATEMMDAAGAELETRMQLEKQDWEAQALQKLEEQIEGVRQFFEPQLNEALVAARNAEAHANKQTELSNQLWANFQVKQQEVDFLQLRLNAATTSSTQSLAKEHQDEAIALLNQKDLEIKRLGDRLTKANSEVDYNIKARDDVAAEAETHVKEIKNLEERLEVVRGVNRNLYSGGVEKDRKIHKLEKALNGVQNLSEASQESQNLEKRLEVVRGVNRDLYSAGVEKDRKIYRLEMAIEQAQNLSKASQELSKGINKSDEESQALIQGPDSSRNASNDARLLEETMAKSSRNERLVHKLRRKLANQEKESDTILMALKTGMTASLKEALEEKKKAVHKLAIMQDSGNLVQLKKEHQIFEQRNKDMARKAIEDASDIARLTTQNKLLQSTNQNLLQESRRLELRGDSYKAKLAIESYILDDTNSRISKLTNAIYARDNKLARTVRAQDAKIKALEKTVCEEEKTILMLRQWDAESGVTERDQLIKERDQTIKQYKKDEKELLKHTETLERELLKHQNVSLIEKVSGWIFGTPPV